MRGIDARGLLRGMLRGVEVVCQGCGKIGPRAPTLRAAEDTAECADWLVGYGLYWCPACRESTDEGVWGHDDPVMVRLAGD